MDGLGNKKGERMTVPQPDTVMIPARLLRIARRVLNSVAGRKTLLNKKDTIEKDRFDKTLQ